MPRRVQFTWQSSLGTLLLVWIPLLFRFNHDLAYVNVSNSSERTEPFIARKATEDDFPPVTTSPNTIVTAYFPTRSKHSAESYSQWMEAMLGLNDAMIIFCTQSINATMWQLRQHALNRTVVILMQLEDLPIAKAYSNETWQAQFAMDQEKEIHGGYPLFWIWLSKTYLTMQAIKMNPFNSTYFMWSDIGCLRNGGWVNTEMMLHAADTIPHDRILFKAHKTPNPPPTLWWAAKLEEDHHFYHSGSHMAGTAETFRIFHEAFLQTVQGFVDRNLFMGDDQPVLQCTCLQHPHLCRYVLENGDNYYWGLRSYVHQEYDPNIPTWDPPTLQNSTT